MAILKTTGVSGSLSISSSNIPLSTSASLFNVNGYNGRLLDVVDNLSGSLFSVNSIAGLPIFEVFSNNKVIAGKYNANDFVITGSKVGIGTSSPAELLHLSSSSATDLRIQGFADSTVQFVGPDTHSYSMGLDVSDSDKFKISYTNSKTPPSLGTNDRVVIDTSGNVGIGTTGPIGKLHVSSADGPYAFCVNGTTKGVRFSINSNGTTLEGVDNTLYTSYQNLTLNGSDLKLRTNATDNVLYINNGGKSGFGTASPVSLVHIYENSIATSTDAGLTIENDGTGDAVVQFLLTGLKRWVVGIDNSDGDKFKFASSADLGSTARVTFDGSNGYVGIGTTSPNAMLHVNSSGSLAPGSTVLNVDGTQGSLFSVVDNLTSSLMSVNDISGLPILEVFSDDTVVMGTFNANTLVVTGSKVGIGIAVPTALLHVSGSSAIIDGLTVGRGNGNVKFNTLVGKGSLLNNTTGINNSAFGYKVLVNNTTGTHNIAFGSYTLTNNTTGDYNSAFGAFALNSNSTGRYNAAFGHNALVANLTSSNSAFGINALLKNTTGRENCAFGFYAASENVSGNFNCAVGNSTLNSNVSGAKNTTMGHSGLSSNIGNNNSAFGYKAGSTMTSGANNSFFGYNAQPSSITVSNEITLGNSSVATLRCQVTTITALSDERDKTDIYTLVNGLDIIDKVRPVTYKWDKREWYPNGVRDGSKTETSIRVGFIAQELKQMMTENGYEYLDLVYESDPDKLEATIGNLFVPLVRAVQELHEKVKILEAKIK